MVVDGDDRCGGGAERSGAWRAWRNMPADPGADGGYAIDDSAFDQRFKRAAQDLKQILVEHSGDVVRDDKH